MQSLLRGAARGVLMLLTAAACGSFAAPASAQQQSRPGVGGPTEVRVHLYVRDVSTVDGANQSFQADLVLVAEWSDPRYAGARSGPQEFDLKDLWNPRLILVNGQDAKPQLAERLTVSPQGIVRYRQRYTGRFSEPMDLRDFPLDTQRFEIQVAGLGYSRDEVRLVPHPDTRIPYRSVSWTVADWSMGPALLQESSVDISPRVLSLPAVKLSWQGKRHISYYAVQVIMPLAMIVMLGWTVLMLDHAATPTRVTVANTTMLTLIAYRFSLGNQIPRLSYLTRFDYFMIGSTVLVFSTVVMAVGSAYLVSAGRAEQARRLDKQMRVLFPTVFVLLMLAVWKY